MNRKQIQEKQFQGKRILKLQFTARDMVKHQAQIQRQEKINLMIQNAPYIRECLNGESLMYEFKRNSEKGTKDKA